MSSDLRYCACPKCGSNYVPDGYIPPAELLTEDVMSSINVLMGSVDNMSWEYSRHLRKLGEQVCDKVSWKNFGPALPLGFGFGGWQIDSQGGCPLMEDTEESILEKSFDFTTATRVDDGPGQRGFDLFRIKRVVPSDEKYVRKLIKWPLDRMWLCWQAEVRRNKLGIATIDVLGKKGGEWWCLTKKRLGAEARSRASPGVGPRIEGLRGMCLAMEYCWTVDIGSAQGFRIRLDTDAVGARELLKERDVSPGERRKALLHWVKAHYRRCKRSSGDSDLTWVREYLQGQKEVSWGGIPVRVTPSADDLRRLRQVYGLAV